MPTKQTTFQVLFWYLFTSKCEEMNWRSVFVNGGVKYDLTLVELHLKSTANAEQTRVRTMRDGKCHAM